MTNTETLMRELYEEHASMLLHWTMRLVHDRHAAQDIVQETMVRAWHRHLYADGESSVKGWLLRVARNVAVDSLRSRWARSVDLVEDAGGCHWSTLDTDPTMDIARDLVTREAVVRLSPLHRDVIFEVFFMDRTAPEAARRLGIPLGTVKSRLFYALRELRSTIGTK